MMEMPCIHKSISRQDAVWLPPTDKSYTRNPAQKRVYCVGCGIVKHDGTDRGVKVGHFINKIGEIQSFIRRERRRGVHIKDFTEIQKRLLIKALEESDIFWDRYSITKKMQEAEFLRIARLIHPCLPERVIKVVLHSSKRPMKKRRRRANPSGEVD